MEIASSTATWPVVQGDLGSCLSVESSLCPLDQSLVVSAPLILQRPSLDAPNSTPCDITILFPKRHEIRQIYVRSTARIYEIYYAPNSTSPNEYLCTVRCSLALNDANDNEPLKETEYNFVGETSSRSSNTSTSEDGWVDINKSLESNTSKINVSPPRTKEDLYEATAEISDADPCISLTIRLLSIQSNGYVCVDEIYVFGDPVDDDTEDQKNPKGSTAGSSLMALLAPTLLQLQLSKSGIGRTTNDFDRKQPKDESSHSIGSQGDELMITNTHENPPEIRSSVPNPLAATYCAGSVPGNTAEPKQLHTSIRIPDEAVNHNFTTKNNPCNVEKALNELISRVIKIEDTCSRFEENMRKPICSIEERLSRVEQQLSVLTKHSQNSKTSCGTRFSAPDWSCVESASNSSDVDESNPVCATANTNDIPSISLPAQPQGSGSSISMDTDEVFPSLSSTAPQYVDHDAEDTDPPILEATPLEQPKKTVSIDDALASALAAFMSPVHPQTLTKAFSMTAPEFSTSEESENNNVHSSVSHSPQITSSIIHEDETEVTGCEESSTSISNDVVLEAQELLDNDISTCHIEEHNEDGSSSIFEDISQFTNGKDPQVEAHPANSSSDKFEGDVQYVIDEDAHDIHKLESNRSNNDPVNIEYTSEEDRGSDMFLSLAHDVGDHQQKAKNDREATNQEAMLQVIELARMPSQVKFDTSILDVMFVSGEISSTNSSSLEALLTDTAAYYQVEVPHDAEVGGGVDDAKTDHDFISVEQQTSSLATLDSFLNMDHYDLGSTSMVMENTLKENEGIHDHPSHLSHEVFPGSLI
ncbi:unnamed protein product [Rhodiola kirilowii]